MILGRFKHYSFGNPFNPADSDYNPLAIQPEATYIPSGTTNVPPPVNTKVGAGIPGAPGSGTSTVVILPTAQVDNGWISTFPEVAAGIGIIDILVYGAIGYAAYSYFKK